MQLRIYLSGINRPVLESYVWLGLAFVCLVSTKCVMQPNPTVLTGHSVHVDLQTARGTFEEWPEEELRVVPGEVIVGGGETIHFLLRNNGIRPDVEAFSLVYELNPKLPSLKNLEEGSRLLLPRVTPDNLDLVRRIAAGSLLVVTVDSELKEEFAENVKSLTAILPRLAELGTKGFAEGVPREATLAMSRNVTETLEFVRLRILRRNGRPMTREALEQLNADAELLAVILSRVVQGQRKISPDDVATIAAIERDIEIKKRRFVQIAAGALPKRWPIVDVVVRTLERGQVVHNIRVVYVPEALKRNPKKVRAFDKLSSPTARAMPEADYVIWAVDEESNKRISNEHYLAVREGSGKIEVDLTILR